MPWPNDARMEGGEQSAHGVALSGYTAPMRALPQFLFDIHALSLPRGHGFGERPPCGAWQSDDGKSCAIATRHVDSGELGLVVMRRREDGPWIVTCETSGFVDMERLLERAAQELREDEAPEPLPPATPRRATLHDLQGREPSSSFRLLTNRSHRNVAWLLNQLYLALPRPDRNWAADCQTENFHTRLWEAQLLASFREQGLLVEQPEESPDFRISNRRGAAAWVEAVTANPAVRFDPVGAVPSLQPDEPDELFFGAAALRFAKTIGSKLQRRYDLLPHVAQGPFVLALADFHAPGSMVWSREALIGYLYGIKAEPRIIAGRKVAVGTEASTLLGASGFPAGLFRDGRASELSALIFTNACSLAKFNRVMASGGAPTHGARYIRYGRFENRTAGALEGIPFCLDVTSDAYRGLWQDHGYEPWCAELEVFHNPFARHPLPLDLLPEAAHWLEVDGAMDVVRHHEQAILWSRTLVQDEDDPIPTYETIPQHITMLASKRLKRED